MRTFRTPIHRDDQPSSLKVALLLACLTLLGITNVHLGYAAAAITSSLTVTAQANGSGLNGMYVAVELYGSVVATGFTPVTFSLTAGQTYQVVADNYDPYSFLQWSSGSTSDPVTITAGSSGSTTTLTVTYTTSGSSSSLMVTSQANGNSLNGM